MTIELLGERERK